MDLDPFQKSLNYSMHLMCCLNFCKLLIISVEHSKSHRITIIDPQINQGTTFLYLVHVVDPIWLLFHGIESNLGFASYLWERNPFEHIKWYRERLALQVFYARISHDNLKKTWCMWGLVLEIGKQKSKIGRVPYQKKKERMIYVNTEWGDNS